MIDRFFLPGKSVSTFAFRKGSPLLPFFRYAYNKIRQTGALHRHSTKWSTQDQSIGCDSKNELTPISFNKIVSLVAVLFLGIFMALVTYIFEKMYFKKARPKTMKWNSYKVFRSRRKKSIRMSGRILVNIRGKFSWTKWVNSHGHLLLTTDKSRFKKDVGRS